LYVGTRKTQGKAVRFALHHATQNGLCMSRKMGCKAAVLHALIRSLETPPMLVVRLWLAAARSRHESRALADDVDFQ